MPRADHRNSAKRSADQGVAGIGCVGCGGRCSWSKIALTKDHILWRAFGAEIAICSRCCVHQIAARSTGACPAVGALAGPTCRRLCATRDLRLSRAHGCKAAPPRTAARVAPDSRRPGCCRTHSVTPGSPCTTCRTNSLDRFHISASSGKVKWRSFKDSRRSFACMMALLGGRATSSARPPTASRGTASTSV